MLRNSTAQRRIRQASNCAATMPQPRTPSMETNPRHVQWTFTTCLQDAIQKPSSIGAGRRYATQLHGAAAHPPSAQPCRYDTPAGPELHRWKPIPGMCGGHSPLVPAYGMPYRSLRRSSQEAAMLRNSRAQRCIRRAPNRADVKVPQ